ncbi:MAG: hypothetical protein AAF721_16020 [Myxococcota bacterium]
MRASIAWAAGLAIATACSVENPLYRADIDGTTTSAASGSASANDEGEPGDASASDGLDEAGEGEGGEGPELDAGDGDDCMGAGLCLPVPDAQWKGPVAVFRNAAGAIPASCPAPYPAHVRTAATGPIPYDSLPCCACAPTAPTCTDPVITQYGPSKNNCAGAKVGMPSPAACLNGAEVEDGFYRYDSDIVAPPGCAASGPDLDTVTDDQVVICEGALFGAPCLGGVCVPDPGPLPARMCVYTLEADLPCPEGWADEVHVVFDVVAPTCPPCTCETTGGGCSVGLLNYPAADCQGAPMEVEADECNPSDALAETASHEPVAVPVPGQCSVSPDQDGMLETQLEWTVCCSDR